MTIALCDTPHLHHSRPGSASMMQLPDSTGAKPALTHFSYAKSNASAIFSLEGSHHPFCVFWVDEPRRKISGSAVEEKRVSH